MDNIILCKQYYMLQKLLIYFSRFSVSLHSIVTKYINIKFFERIVKAIQLPFPGGKANGYYHHNSCNGWIFKA